MLQIGIFFKVFWANDATQRAVSRTLKPLDAEYLLDFETDENGFIKNVPESAKFQLSPSGDDNSGKNLVYNCQVVGYFNTRTRDLAVQNTEFIFHISLIFGI